MKEPFWLTLDAVLAMHDRLVAEHGGDAGVRDRGLLESALANPKNQFAYGSPDLYALAAAYANAITRNHPFVDGNKRTAFLAAYVFLGMNRIELDAGEIDVVRMVEDLSRRALSVEDFAAWLKSASSGKPARKPTPRSPRRKRGS